MIEQRIKRLRAKLAAVVGPELGPVVGAMIAARRSVASLTWRASVGGERIAVTLEIQRTGHRRVGRVTGKPGNPPEVGGEF